MSRKNHTNKEKPHESEVERLLEVSDCDTLAELGEKLGYASGNAITNWKKRGLDYNKVLDAFPTISVQYLKTGEGPKKLDKFEKGFKDIKDRTAEEGIPYNARDLLIEALVEEANKIQSDLQDLAKNIERLKGLRTDDQK